jgi:hypothetical protein
MALFKRYEELTPFERVEFIGKLVHAAQSNAASFYAAKEIIKNAEEDGVLDGVTILPERENFDNGKEEETA